MAFRIGPDEDDLQETHEINVTPFIDVMLVLLIIFMVAAPLSTVDVPIDLPRIRADAQPDQEAITVSLETSQVLRLNQEPVTAEDLPIRLDALSKGDKQRRVFLQADQSVSYGQLTRLMNLVRAAGYAQIALVGLPPGDAAP